VDSLVIALALRGGGIPPHLIKKFVEEIKKKDLNDKAAK